jgi:hypothetical protein
VAINLAGAAFIPTEEQIAATNAMRLARKLGCDQYHELHRVSVEEPDRFWPALVEDLELVAAEEGR